MALSPGGEEAVDMKRLPRRVRGRLSALLSIGGPHPHRPGRPERPPRGLRTYLRQEGRDPNGRHGEDWAASRRDSPLEFLVLHMGPVARAYWRVAAYDGR
jgi:hypothetical protein